jgi:hypothetical protein
MHKNNLTISLGVLGPTILVTALALPQSGRAQEAGPLPQKLTLSITTDGAEPVSVDLALDEVELGRSDSGGGSHDALPAPVGTSRARLKARADDRAVFLASGARSLPEMKGLVRELEARNPGRSGYLVLYASGQPRTDATRQLLGRTVAVLFAHHWDPSMTFRVVGALNARPVAALPDAYVVEASDPLAALDLAAALRVTPGVTTAYPLLKRMQFPR